MSWQAYTATSVLTLSVSVLLQRILLSKNKLDPYAYAVTFQGIVAIILTVFALLAGLNLAGISAVWLPSIISVLAFGVGHIIYAKTLQHVEASVFSVLFATQAIWIMLLGVILFDESMTVLQIVGTLLIFGSVGVVSKNLKSLSLDKGTLLGLLTGAFFGVAITAWSYVGRHIDGLSWAAISFIGTTLVALLIKPSTRQKIPKLLTGNMLTKLILLGTLYAVGSICMLYAYKEGTFTEVTPLRQTSIIVTTLLALLVLADERAHIFTKLVAATVCFAGVMLIIV